MKNYLIAKKEWDGLAKAKRSALLKKHGRDYALAARCYAFLPHEVRQDIQPTLIKEAATKVVPVASKQYWWVEA